jgi:putative phosphoribosyl transferase
MFRDRHEAGRRLAALVADLSVLADLAVADRAAATGASGRPGVVVLGLPRGGVPVAAEVAGRLGATLDVFPVRKVGVPGHEELAMGAVAPGGARVVNDDVVRQAGVSADELEAAFARQLDAVSRQALAYRGDRPPPRLAGQVVIVVDDGLATGATMRAAIEAVRQQQPAVVVVAVPVAPAAAIRELAALVDELVCVSTPESFYAVGSWYGDFSPTTDEEVRRLLADAMGDT